MNIKLLVIIILILTTAWDLAMTVLDIKSAKNPIPDNVKDVYDEETYLKWREYNREKAVLEIKEDLIKLVINIVVICLDVYGLAVKNVVNPIWSGLLVIVVDSVISSIVDIPFNYINSFDIEQRYGFNKTNIKTFVVDQIRNFILGIVLVGGLVVILYGLHSLLGDSLLIAFAIVLFLITLAISFLSPFLLKIANKFTSLEEGELRDALTSLLTKNGYTVRDIKVMDASRRTTKSNAMFTGFGKTKTIILFDNLVNQFTPEEICAVFAHEMGHGMHKDTLKLQVLNFVRMLGLAAMASIVVKYPSMYHQFGFRTLNYGFAYILLGYGLALFMPVFGLLTNYFSRKFEYRADEQASKEGYGAALIAALKKLARENFANLAPHPLTIKLSYSHPTISQRIDAIKNAEK